MSIKIDHQYKTYLAKKYGNLHTVEDANVYNNGVREDLAIISAPGTSFNFGGAHYRWDYTAVANDNGEQVITGSSIGFSDVTSYFDADKNNQFVCNFWNPVSEAYQTVTLIISERPELIGYRYFKVEPGYGAGYWGDSVRAHDLKFYGANKEWAYDVIQGEASYPEKEGRWGDLPKKLIYYTTDSPFVSYIQNQTTDFFNNLHIVPIIFSYVKNVDGNWVGKLGFGVYRNTYGVKTWKHSLVSMQDTEIKTFICPDENGPFGNWFVDIGSLDLSKQTQWFEGLYSVNLSSNVTIE